VKSNKNSKKTAAIPTASSRHHSNDISLDQNSSSIVKPMVAHEKRHCGKKQQRVLKQQTNVIYVKSCNAKAAKNELEKRGLLDKRYKMMPMPNNDEIAIPVIILTNPQNYFDVSCNDDDHYGNGIVTLPTLPQWAIRNGTEYVPYSSSFLGRMKNKSVSLLSGCDR
jgi:hypothetical protein